MNLLKRPSPDALLPVARPAKVPRTSQQRVDGQNSSPSQYEALAARWKDCGMQSLALLKETIAVGVTTLFGGEVTQSAATSYLISPPPSSPPSPPRPAVAPQPQPTATSSKSSIQSHGHPSAYQQPEASTSRLQPRSSSAKRRETGLLSPPSSLATSSSSTSFVGLYPELEEKLKDVRTQKDKAIRRPVKHRQHIYHSKFKADVQEDRRKGREDMERELYDLRRREGYRSSLKEFRGWLGYKERLEMLERRESLAPSPSLVDLRQAQGSGSSRRYSMPEPPSSGFLERALRNAQATLKSPKPPPPFSPNLDQLRHWKLARDDEIEQRLRPKRKPLPASLPREDDAAVDVLMSKRGVISKCVREQVSDKDLSRLRPGQWLNDELINFYGQLILSRSEDSKENPRATGSKNGRLKPLNAHYFNTFFWSKLKNEGYEKARLAKWTKKIDIFSKDVILIPINHNNAHWTGAAINFRHKRIESYDSMNMDRSQVFKYLRSYLDAEHRNKKKKPFDFTGWQDYTFEDTPQQENGYDCGVFTCQFLESLSRGEQSFAFTQADMGYLRRRMVWEIGHARLREDT